MKISPKLGKLGEKQMEISKYETKKNRERKTYPQDWKSYNLCQTNELSLFQDILIELIDSLIDVKETPKGKGRPFGNLKEMLFCCVSRAYFGKSSRRSVSFLDYAIAKKYISKKPHFNTLLNYYRSMELTRILKHMVEQSATPLKDIESDFAIDSSGFCTSLFGRWLDVRASDNSKKRIFKKAHVTSGVKTNIITAIEVTSGYFADSPEFENLIKITAKNFAMREISADKGYSSRKNMSFASEMGAIPFIPFKKNASDKSKGSMTWARMKKYFDEHKEEFMEHYHKRSNAETVFHMIKRKFGMHLNSRFEIGQVNEVLCKALCHNICVLIQEMFELGINAEFNNCAKMVISIPTS